MPQFAPRVILCLLGSLALLPLAAGCNVAALASQRLMPPPMIYAKYQPKAEPMLVLIENFDNPSVNHIGAQQLTAQLRQELTAHQVAPLVDADALDLLRDTNPAGYRSMSIPQIGRATGAKQVLYLNLQQMGLSSDGIMARASASGRLKIVDTTTGETRWPTDTVDGYPVSLQTPFVRVDQKTNETALNQQMIQSLADQVAKLLYNHRAAEGIN
ncbi:MAG TPA: hypothetical protein VGN72_15870 [Tepidisphaeraceae bacterium]|jgi:hypothetical protein|nr:hypothetical protein [Tepidisphaeraceae bacterium]